MSHRVRRLVATIVIVTVTGAVGLAVVRPSLGAEASQQAAARFGFDVVTVNGEPDGARSERSVAPDLDKIRRWVSAVGAAAALADLRGAGRPSDMCLVDPRDDSVTISAVPATGGSYPPVQLTPRGLPFDSTMAPMGCVPADLDEDGDLDVVVPYWGRPPVLYLNTAGTGTPRQDGFRPTELVTPTTVWNSTTLNVGDVDGDGHLDLLVGNYFPDGARVLDPDAGPDRRIEMQDSMALARNGGVNRLLLTSPTGQPDTPPRVTDASLALSETAAGAWTLATGLQDLTGDGLPEIYLANDFGPDHLLVNHSTPGAVRLSEVRGDRTLVTPKSQVLGRDSFKGMGVAFSYSDDVALPTIVVSNITTPFALHESNFAFVPTGDGAALLEGRLPFQDRSEELGIARGGWCWDVRAGDFDNDGADELLQANGFLTGEVDRWPMLQELAMGNDQLLRFPAAWPEFGPEADLSGQEPNRFWVAGPDGRYEDLAEEVGTAAPDNSRAVALGDIDDDGRLDALVANQWQDSILLRNTADAGPAVRLRLLRPGVAGVVPAIGAHVRLHHPRRPQQAQLYPANGHTGVSDSSVHLALPGGAPTEATVSWRDAGGTWHTTRIEVRPGSYDILLEPDGTAVAR